MGGKDRNIIKNKNGNPLLSIKVSVLTFFATVIAEKYQASVALNTFVVYCLLLL